MDVYYRIQTTNFSKMFKNYLQHRLEKWDWIKRNTLIGRMNIVELGIIDVDSKFYATKASWISRIINTKSITHRTLSDILIFYSHTIYLFFMKLIIMNIIWMNPSSSECWISLDFTDMSFQHSMDVQCLNTLKIWIMMTL